MDQERVLAPGGPPPVVWLLAAVFTAIELLLWLSDQQLLGEGPIASDLRWQIYLRFAFFDLYFDAALDGQPVPWWLWTSCLSHAVLHGGWLHLAMNAVFLLAAGGMVARVIGTGRFLLLFVLTAIAGALVFGLMAETRGPLVGASGALFGILGALKRWEWRYVAMTGEGSARFWRTIAALVAINVLLAFAYPGGGELAWQAHLGGFIAGFIIAAPLAPRLAGVSPL
ncbi:MAG: rhomboid family intramembrane serine protease [Pseudomonadota bacterium]